MMFDVRSFVKEYNLYDTAALEIILEDVERNYELFCLAIEHTDTADLRRTLHSLKGTFWLQFCPSLMDSVYLLHQEVHNERPKNSIINGQVLMIVTQLPGVIQDLKNYIDDYNSDTNHAG